MPRRASLLLTTVALVVAVGVGGCAQRADDSPLSSGGGWLDPDDMLDREIDEPIAPGTGLGGGDAPSADEVVQAALRDAEAFWARAYDDVYGEPYEPIFDAYRSGFVDGLDACETPLA